MGSAAVKVLHPASYGARNIFTVSSFPPYAVRKGDFFMQRNRKKRTIGLFGSLKVMTLAAMLTAMSVVVGIFCKTFLNFGAGLFRVTFENLPILLSGIMFGPLVGGLVGAASDIVSYLMSPQAYPINLTVTLGAAMIGVISGAISKYAFKKRGYTRIIVSAASAHVISSMIIKPIGLYSYYGALVLWRIPLYLLIAPLEITLICMMYRNAAVRRIVDGGVWGDI